MLVVELILAQGSVTTEDLKAKGYEHPPRAIKDVKDQGIPLVRSWTKNAEGKKIAEYRFGSPKDLRIDQLKGRKAIPKRLKQDILNAHGSRCAICRATGNTRSLQADHRVPYEVSGDDGTLNLDEFMPLCTSCNRAKSWSCESCENWKHTRDLTVCRTCHWATPEGYSHVAGTDIRTLYLTWEGQETKLFDRLTACAKQQGIAAEDLAKKILQQAVRQSR